MEYCALAKKYCVVFIALQDFQFSIAKRTTDTLTLEWKRVQKDVKFCLGTFNFEKIDDCESAIRSILSACCKSLKSYSSSLDLSKKNNDILTKEFEVLQNDMKKCVALKENLENELLAKFVLIINEKKAKIRSLQKRLENCEPIKVAEGSSNPPVKTISEVNLLPQKESIPSSKAQKLKLEDSFDGGPVIPKRKRTTNKQPLTLSISPAKKTKDTPVSPVKFPSDCTGSSSDSTVDVNDLLEEI